METNDVFETTAKRYANQIEDAVMEMMFTAYDLKVITMLDELLADELTGNGYADQVAMEVIEHAYGITSVNSLFCPYEKYNV